MRRLALAAALLLAPALAAAQLPGTPAGIRTYTFAGCDNSYADLFGPGARACATSAITIRDVAGTWSELTFSVALEHFAGYLASPTAGAGFGPTFSGQATYFDGVTFGLCSTQVCRGGTSTLFVRLPVAAGYVPTVVQVGGAYVPDSIATGRDPFGVPLFPRYIAHLTLTATPALTEAPEPATVLLTGGGLVGLLGMARRRRTA